MWWSRGRSRTAPAASRRGCGGCAVVVAAGLAVFGLSRAGLLTADDLSSDPEPTDDRHGRAGRPASAAGGPAGRPAAAGRDGRAGARCPAARRPAGRRAAGPDAAAARHGAAGPGRCRPAAGRRGRRAGAGGPGPPALAVARAGRRGGRRRPPPSAGPWSCAAATLVEVEIATGGVTDAEPYPGFDADVWTPEGLLAATGSGALVMTQPRGRRACRPWRWPGRPGWCGPAWSRRSSRIGTVGPLLGIADDWVITLGPGCPGTACRIQVVSVTRDQAADPRRRAAGRAGPSCAGRPPAGPTRPWCPVEHLTGGKPDGLFALARLVPGGDNALLVGGTSRRRPGRRAGRRSRRQRLPAHRAGDRRADPGPGVGAAEPRPAPGSCPRTRVPGRCPAWSASAAEASERAAASRPVVAAHPFG